VIKYQFIAIDKQKLLSCWKGIQASQENSFAEKLTSTRKIMAKKVKQILKLNLPAGSATPAPPVGPILGQAGINMMDFLKQYNDKTSDKRGQIIPAEITIFEDRSFTFVLKLPPVADLIKQTAKLKKGNALPGKENKGQLTMAQVREIAEKKLADMNTTNLDAAMKSVIGSANSMGVDIKD
jgi:large subunit ribosomal protein L11